MDVKGYSRRTRSEENNIKGQLGNNYPLKDSNVDELFITDCTSNAYKQVEQNEAKQRQKYNF